uniref:Uncharacterized protein n=1 Tax=Anguilla anguilla TaxID=7936 RepID=A0A0E9SWX3_ANGAN
MDNRTLVSICYSVRMCTQVHHPLS